MKKYFKKLAVRKFIIISLVVLFVSALIIVQKIGGDRLKSSAATTIPDNPTAPLKVDPNNNRYFIDTNGKHIYFAGNSGAKFSTLNMTNASNPVDVTPAQYQAEIDAFLNNNSDVNDDLNYLRLWTLRPWSWVGDTAADKADRTRFPWKEVNDYVNGSYTFEMDEWDTTYWNNLKGYVAYAQQKGVYISFLVFDECGIEGSRDGKTAMWQKHPFYDGVEHPTTKTGLTGTTGIPGFYDAWGDTNLLNVEIYQKAYIDKIVDELKTYNNVIFEVANEYSDNEGWERSVSDYLSDRLDTVHAANPNSYWLTRIVSTSELGSAMGTAPNFGHQFKWTDPKVDYVNFHKTISLADYANLWMKDLYGKGKPINCNECSANSSVTEMRLRSYGLFTLGAHLSFEDANDADGNGDYARGEIVSVLSKFQRFVRLAYVIGDENNRGVRFWEMKPNNNYFKADGSSNTFVTATPSGQEAFTLSNPGKEYVVLLPGGVNNTNPLRVRLPDISGTGKQYRVMTFDNHPGSSPEFVDVPNIDRPTGSNTSETTISNIANLSSSSQLIYIRAISVGPSYETKIINDTTLQVNSSQEDPFDLTHLNTTDNRKVYTDRDYLATNIPAELTGENTDWIRTANDDKSTTNNPFATFKVKQDGYVYVIYDKDQSVPTWLSGWESRTDRFSRTSTTPPDTEYKLFRKYFTNGSDVSLGPNVTSGTGNNMYLVAAYPAAAPCSNPLICDVAPTNYQVVSHLVDGSTYYLDRPYTIVNSTSQPLPPVISGTNSQWIKTSNETDKTSTSASFLNFSLVAEGDVYVAYDSRANALPDWLRSTNGWVDIQTNLYVSDGNMDHFKLYRKHFPIGSVSLGGNMATGSAGAQSMYIVIGVPGQTRPMLLINKSAPNTVSPGGNVTFSITVRNNGTARATNIILSDPIDTASLTFVPDPNNGSQYNNGIVSWQPFDLDPGAERTVTFIAQANSQQVAVLVGAGDIAYSGTDFVQHKTAALIQGIAGTVFTAGDNNQSSTTDYNTKMSEYQNYFEPTWGQFKNRMKPAMGNHDYMGGQTTQAYHDYFGAIAGLVGKGYYSYDLGAWHIVVLNSNIEYTSGSTQEQWLRSDLASSTSLCTLAIWHHPRFSSGEHGNNASYNTFWQDLYNDGAEIVVNGHDHEYERFAPQRPDQTRDDANGIREFVVGTGGAPNRNFGTIQPNSEARRVNHGVIKFTLYSDRYEWQFIHVDDSAVYDSGSTNCH